MSYNTVSFFPLRDDTNYSYPYGDYRDLAGLCKSIADLVKDYTSGKFIQRAQPIKRRLVVVLAGRHDCDLMEQAKEKLGANSLELTDRGSSADIWFMTFEKSEGVINA
jgi:hypothetical protein